ncbi:MAG: hypothetical protein CEO40_108 [Parcubacteria group bacterium LiPW_72]|nr:MAG: hypothetical protein CEO40_108 [Parcubacteria group bacterium LiPW_72]
MAEDLIKYEELPMIQKDGGCFQCGFYPAISIERETDQGGQRLLQCPRCGKIMKPYCPSDNPNQASRSDSRSGRRIIRHINTDPYE